MDSKTLLAAYMRAKNMTQLKEVAEELGFSGPYVSEIKNGIKQFTDETAKFLAEEAGLDPYEVIISLNAVRAKTPEMKATWYDILKKYCASTEAALAVACLMTGSASLAGSPTALIIFLC
ncbi:TPA: helix-turn-helix domain-containing protein [Aeromonas hydrophila]|uniref:helix-turn-helix domain-containing protein n=1 Tax=Aeromonas hydrophila TaxID=644 RepID=UPI000DED8ED7|nr:helix-turn-helix domain-containing protein [Aeromonas hydrophila]HAU4875743.1 helix-turn-helix domain-containing protein [Aeromonas hydrophila]